MQSEVSILPWAWKRRTTDRIAIARVVLGFISRLSYGAAGACAAVAYQSPPRFRATRAERRALEAAAVSRLRTASGDVAIWQWGDGPRVLLAHGWGSHAGRLTRFLPELLAAGFGVTAFDAPGHGLSTGRLSSVREFVEAFREVSRLVSPVATIGHSLGAAASVLAAASGGTVRAAVLLAPPAKMSSYPRRFARYVRLAPGASNRMEAHLERRLGRLPELDRPECWPGIPVLVFHDRRDTRVPVREGLAIARAWPETRIVVTRGLGHHRIAGDEAVIRRSVRFLARAALGAPVALAGRRQAC